MVYISFNKTSTQIILWLSCCFFRVFLSRVVVFFNVRFLSFNLKIIKQADRQFVLLISVEQTSA